MAAKKQASFVARVGKGGRRFYKREFIDALVADVQSGKASRADQARKFGIPSSIISRWVKRATVGTARSQTVSRQKSELRLTQTVKPHGSLLERAVKAPSARPKQSDVVNEAIGQQVELALAYLTGEIDELQVRYALDRPSGKFMAVNWLGHVFAGAIRSGWRLTR